MLRPRRAICERCRFSTDSNMTARPHTSAPCSRIRSCPRIPAMESDLEVSLRPLLYVSASCSSFSRDSFCGRHLVVQVSSRQWTWTLMAKLGWVAESLLSLPGTRRNFKEQKRGRRILYDPGVLEGIYYGDSRTAGTYRVASIRRNIPDATCAGDGRLLARKTCSPTSASAHNYVLLSAYKCV